MTETETIQSILNALHARRCAEFRINGESYLIQPDNNKGCDYLSLWRTAPRAERLGAALYDVMVGVDEDAVQELSHLPCIHGRSLLDCGDIQWL